MINYWVVLYTTATLLSFLGQIVIVALYFKQKGKSYSKSSQDILLRMAISDAIFCIGKMEMLYPDGRTNEQIIVRCTIYSFLFQFGTLALCFNCFCLCLFSYKSFTYTEEIIKKYTNWSLIFCFGIPLIIASITTSLKQTVPSQYTCFVTGLKQGEGAFEFFMLFYVPLTTFMFLNLIFVIQSYLHVKELRRLNGLKLEIEAASGILLNMLFYPIIFFISQSGFIIQRIEFLVTQDASVFKAQGLLVTLNVSQGFLNSLVYIFNYRRTVQLVEDLFSQNNSNLKETSKIDSVESSQQELVNRSSLMKT